MKRNVLFVCVQNGARSQMAEAFLNEICPDDYAAESAGLEPGELNPLAVAAMTEAGIDISSKHTKAVFDLFKSGKLYSYVITVCDETSAERCPISPDKHGDCTGASPTRQPWQARGKNALRRPAEIRDEIRARIVEWCTETCGAAP